MCECVRLVFYLISRYMRPEVSWQRTALGFYRYIDILQHPSTQPQDSTVMVRLPALLPPIPLEKRK